MPSPIAHAATGYLIYRIASRRLADQGSASLPAGQDTGAANPRAWVASLRKLLPTAMLVPIVFSLLPDVDALAGMLSNNMVRFHNNATHSLVAGFLVSLLFAIVLWRRLGQTVPYWLAVAFSGYAAHILMDAATYDNRGVMLFWPLTATRFNAPFILFYGVRWGNGIISIAHLITLTTELGFCVLIALVVSLLDRRLGQAQYRVP